MSSKSRQSIVIMLVILFSTAMIDAASAAWTNKSTVSGMQAKYWNGLDMSDDGSVMVAVASSGGGIYVSTDSGATWVNRTPAGSRVNSNWAAVTMSSDGARIAVIDWNSDIWTSSDTGVTWTDRTPSGSAHNLPWQCLAGSSNGKVLLAGTYTGARWKSTDYGVTWTSDGTNTFYQSCAMNASGQRQAAAVYLGYVAISNDTGTSWTNQTSIGALGWYGLDMSPDGTKIAAASSTGNVFVSANSGTSWVDKGLNIPDTSNNFFYSVSLSSDGQTILVAGSNVNSGGILWLSIDGGNTWTAQDTTSPMNGEGQFWPAKVSLNGQYLLAGGMSGTAGKGNLYLNVTVMPASINSLTIGSGNPPLYRKTSVLQANLGVAGSDGKVTFYANSKRIGGCIKITSVSLVATCNWRPSVHGVVTIKVELTPTDSAFSSTARSFALNVSARSDNR